MVTICLIFDKKSSRIANYLRMILGIFFLILNLNHLLVNSVILVLNLNELSAHTERGAKRKILLLKPLLILLPLMKTVKG